jgi:hypothetical protein
LTEKQMRHRHNSVCASRDYSEPTMTEINSNSDSDRWRQKMDGVIFH